MPLSPQELASTVEALHDAVLRRLSWSVFKDFEDSWRDMLSLDNAQTIIDTLVSSYVKGMMAFQEASFDKSPTYIDMFSMPDEIWDLLAGITTATEWDEVPYHKRHTTGCVACEKFKRH